MKVKILTLLCLSLVLACNTSDKSAKKISAGEAEGVYEGVFIDVNDTIIPPDIDPNVEISRRLLKNVNLSGRNDFWEPKSNFYLHGMGSIKVRDSGFYHMKLTSAGGVLFKFDNVEHIKHKEIHDRSEYMAKVFFEEGFTIIEYEYFSGDKEPYLVLEWSRDGETGDRIPVKATASLHSLRKSAITNWFKGGADIATVKELAGHADLSTTLQFYAAVTDEQREKARRAASEAIGDPSGTQIGRATD